MQKFKVNIFEGFYVEQQYVLLVKSNGLNSKFASRIYMYGM